MTREKLLEQAINNLIAICCPVYAESHFIDAAAIAAGLDFDGAASKRLNDKAATKLQASIEEAVAAFEEKYLNTPVKGKLNR